MSPKSKGGKQQDKQEAAALAAAVAATEAAPVRKRPLGRPAGLEFAEQQGIHHRRGSVNRPPPPGEKPSRFRSSILGGESFKDPSMDGAKLRTTKGDFKAELFMDQLPVTSSNFADLASASRARAYAAEQHRTVCMRL